VSVGDNTSRQLGLNLSRTHSWVWALSESGVSFMFACTEGQPLQLVVMADVPT
jgi:hypothetical protein